MGERWVVLLTLCALSMARADLAGRVVGPDGAPVAGGTVLVTVRDERGMARPVIKRTSEADGGFRVACPDQDAYVWALKGDLSTQPAKLTAGRPMDLILRPCWPIHGQVLTPEGAPAAGALVGVQSVGGVAWDRAESPLTAEADALGWFTLIGVPVGAGFYLFATQGEQQASRFSDAPGWMSVLMLSPDTQRRRFGQPERLKVTVMAGDHPCPQVQVLLRRTEGGRDDWQSLGFVAAEVDTRPGQWRVRVEDWDLPEGWLPGPDQTVRVRAEGVAEVTLQLQRAATIVGRVTRPDGRPGAKVSVTGEIGGRTFWSRTDAEGEYRLRVPAGPVVVKCVDRHQRVQADLPPAEPLRVDFSVKLPEPIQVQVVLPDGRPAAGAEVYFDEVGSQTAGNEGRLVFEPGGYRHLPPMSASWRDDQGQSWGKHESGQQWEDEGDAPKPVRVVLARSEQRLMPGRVVDTAGRPLEQALVGLLLGVEDARDHAGPQFRLSGQIVSDAQGAYSFAEPSPADSSWEQFAERRFTVLKPGYRPTRVMEIGGQPPERRISDAVMEPLDGRLAGQVVDALGQPVAGAQLLIEDCPPRADQRTGADGRFDLAMAPRTGEQTLLALVGDRLLARAKVQAGQAGLRLMLAEPAPPSPEHGHAAALDALDRLHALLGGEYDWDVATETLAAACGIDAQRGLAWLGEIDDPLLARRALARCLPCLALANPRAALDAMIEAERVEPWPLRAKAIGGLVDNLPDPLEPAAVQALARTLAGRPGDWGEGDTLAWADLIAAMARVGHDATRHAIGVWRQEAYNEEDDLVRRLWRRPDVAMVLVTSSRRIAENHTVVGHNVAAMAGCLARLARRDPAAALRWWRQLKLSLDGDGTAPGDVQELAECLAGVDIDTALDIAAQTGIALMPDGGLRGRILLAMPDCADAAQRLRGMFGKVAPSGGMVRAAGVLDRTSAATWLGGLRANGLRTEDCIDLAETAPNHARLHLEWLTSQLVSVPRATESRWGSDSRQPVPMGQTLHAAVLRAWCALDPDRAVALADAAHLGVAERQARLLFVARALGGLDR